MNCSKCNERVNIRCASCGVCFKCTCECKPVPRWDRKHKLKSKEHEIRFVKNKISYDETLRNKSIDEFDDENDNYINKSALETL